MQLASWLLNLIVHSSHVALAAAAGTALRDLLQGRAIVSGSQVISTLLTALPAAMGRLGARTELLAVAFDCTTGDMESAVARSSGDLSKPDRTALSVVQRHIEIERIVDLLEVIVG